MLSSHYFLCPPLRLPPWTVPFRIVLASPDDRVTCPTTSVCVFSLKLGCLHGLMVFPILVFTSSLVMWSLYKILRSLWKIAASWLHQNTQRLQAFSGLWTDFRQNLVWWYILLNSMFWLLSECLCPLFKATGMQENSVPVTLHRSLSIFMELWMDRSRYCVETYESHTHLIFSHQYGDFWRKIFIFLAFGHLQTDCFQTW